MKIRIIWSLAACAALFSAHAPAQISSHAPAQVSAPLAGGDIPAEFHAITDQDDYVKRDEMIPMRDGVKLHTVIIIPKGAAGAHDLGPHAV